MAQCGAKTRSGEPCKRHAMVGSTRCKLHGGAVAQANKGNKHAAKPGSLYSDYMTPEEKAIAADLELGSVDEELRLTRIRLMRALKKESEYGDQPELDERVERDGAENVSARLEEKYKVRDYVSIVDRLTARFESLEARRAHLIQSRLDAELKRIELRDKNSGKDESPVGKIVIEVVGGQNARDPHDNDGAAG
jgi:hypothetical protein